MFATHLLVDKANKQRIVLMSDYHEDTKASIPQRIAILNAAKKFDAYLVAEDNGYMCDYVGPDGVTAYPACLQPVLDDLVADPINFDPNKDRQLDLSVFDPEADNEMTPLLLLTHMARAQNIKGHTVECRQPEKISYRNGPISASQVCAAYDALIVRLAGYNDGEICNAFYRHQLERYKTRIAYCPNFFRHLRASSKNLKQALRSSFEAEVLNAYKKIEFENYVNDYMIQGVSQAKAEILASKITVELEEGQDLYKAFLMYLYNFLIDSAVIHEIAIHGQEPIIFIYCGAMHVHSVLPVLQAMGFVLEKVCDASNVAGQSALDMDHYFDLIAVQLNESIDAQSQRSFETIPFLDVFNMKKFSFIDFLADAPKFNQASLLFNVPMSLAGMLLKNQKSQNSLITN